MSLSRHPFHLKTHFQKMIRDYFNYLKSHLYKSFRLLHQQNSKRTWLKYAQSIIFGLVWAPRVLCFAYTFLILWLRISDACISTGSSTQRCCRWAVIKFQTLLEFQPSGRNQHFAAFIIIIFLLCPPIPRRRLNRRDGDPSFSFSHFSLNIIRRANGYKEFARIAGKCSTYVMVRRMDRSSTYLKQKNTFYK